MALDSAPTPGAGTGPDGENPAPGGLTMREALVRQLPYWATAYARTWRASVASSFVSPVFYVLAMGVLLGGFIKSDPARLEGATSYLAFVVPGLVAAHAMQTAVSETMYPVMAMIKWQRVYDSMLATPLTTTHLVAGHLMFAMFRVATACGVFLVVLVPFGVYSTWWGPLAAYPVLLLTGAAFASLVYGMSARLRDPEGFGVFFRLVVFPMFLFSGAFFPVSNLGDVGAAVARATPLWHGVNLTRMLMVDHVNGVVALVNVVVLLALIGVGWRWSVTGLTKRMAA